MTRTYAVTDEMIADIAAGAVKKDVMRFLAEAERSKHLLLVRAVVAVAERVGHECAWELAEAYDLLAGLHQDHPEAVEGVLRYPSVGTWALRALKSLRQKTAAPLSLTYLPGMTLAAAVRAGREVTMEVTVPSGRVVLPSHGVAQVYGAPRRVACRVSVRTGAHGADIRRGQGAGASVPRRAQDAAKGWTGIRRLAASYRETPIEVLLDDIDPYRFPEGWPASRQRPTAVRQWQRALEDAWELLMEHHPWYAEEIRAGVMTVIPLTRPAGRPVSATSRYAFGAFATSLPPNGRQLASLLSHEIQHGKLWALLDLLPLTQVSDADDRPLWYAPWRDDPRPLVALLQGAYAHMAVAAFWRVQRFVDEGEDALRAHAEYARWRRLTGEVIDTLRACGRLTPAGEFFVARMAAAIDGWRDDDVPYKATRRARATARRHQEEWLRRHRS